MITTGYSHENVYVADLDCGPEDVAAIVRPILTAIVDIYGPVDDRRYKGKGEIHITVVKMPNHYHATVDVHGTDFYNLVVHTYQDTHVHLTRNGQPLMKICGEYVNVLSLIIVHAADIHIRLKK